MEIRTIPGYKKPRVGDYKDMKLQWFWKNKKWITVSFWDVDWYVRRYGVNELIIKTMRHFEKNEDGLYPQWAGYEGSKKVKRFFNELWNKNYSIDRLCKEHKFEYNLQLWD
jgi:hypothetical protein